jgi:plastocyanin
MTMNVRHHIGRTLLAVLLPVALVGLAACTNDGNGSTNLSNGPRAQWGALSEDEKATYEYEIPYGTSVKIDQGQQVDLMPQHLDVKVGDSIRIRNKDGRDYMIGPFFVTAGQELAMRFTQPGELSGVCQMNPEGEFLINVTKA